MNKPKKTKKMDRRDFIKKGIQMAGAGVLATGLSRCNLLLDETTGGGLALKGDCGLMVYQNTSDNLTILDPCRNYKATAIPGITIDSTSGSGNFSLSSERLKIAYTPSATAGQLWTANSNGSNPSGPLYTTTGYQISYQNYSIDSSKIVFADTDGGGGGFGVRIVNTDGSGVSGAILAGQIDYPTWSNDGSKVAYINSLVLLTMTSSGSLLGVPNVPASAERPDWSLDSSRILYISTAGNVYSIAATGGSPTTLITGGGCSFPQWSPNESQFAFVRGNQLFTVNADGSNITSCGGLTDVKAVEWR